jgi:hypothetical protein
MDEQPSWERDLDALVRPSFLVEPSLNVQQAIFASVMRATVTAPQPVLVPAMSTAASADNGSISLTAYVLLGAVLLAYAAALSWLQGMFGGGDWLSTLLSQLLAASNLVFGRLRADEPLALVWLVVQRAPWLALLPLAWLLWERDRASAQAA